VKASRRWEAVAVVGGTTAAAAAVGAAFVRPDFQHQWLTLLLVFALVGLLETRGVVTLPVGRGKIGFSAKAYASIGAVYLLGLPGAAASSLASLVTGLVVRRPADIKTLFNSAMSLLVYAWAYWVFESLMVLAGRNVVLMIAAGAAGGLAAWAANQLLVCMVIVADQGVRNVRLQVFARNATDLMPYFLGYGLTGLGVVAAAVWLGDSAALITLAAPVAIVQTATNRWMREQQARVVEAKSGFNATLISLSKAIDLRDHDTEGHCRRVVEYSLMMGRYLKFDDEELLRLCHGALLHDIGKIGVPDAILHKPGPLTEEEWTVMRTHPHLGALMVADVQQLEKAREIILNHHERFDGKGYPRGISGAGVPLAARVFTISDAFDAMISDRPYRKAMTLPAAREEVRRCSGTQFDPICVAAFESISDEDLQSVGTKREQPTEELLSL
jgi:putative nucleotidyltransferase with HDIG domain